MGALDTIQTLQAQAEKILQDLGLALQRAIMNIQDPTQAAVPYRRRYQQWCVEIDKFLVINPHARNYTNLLKEHTRKTMDQMVQQAVYAHGRRNEMQTGLLGDYNKAVGGGLASAPEQGRKAIEGQVGSLIGKMVDGAMPDHIPAGDRNQVKRALTIYVLDLPVVEDGLFVVQSVLSDVAVYLHQKLTFTAKIEETKKKAESLEEVSPAQADQLDAEAGELAKQSAELDKKIEQTIAQNAMQVRGYVKFNPKLVLDPAQAFIKGAELKAGIKLTKNDVQIELGTKLIVRDPFNGNISGTVNPYLNVDVGSNLDLRMDYQNTINNQGQWQGGQFKATLVYRF